MPVIFPAGNWRVKKAFMVCCARQETGAIKNAPARGSKEKSGFP
jgi:hypothetical protein